MIKSMRKTVPENKLFPKSSGQKMYEDMLDSELATHSARTQGLGLAEDLYQQLEKLLPEKK
jgi:flagellar protein FlgJ